MDPQGRRAYVFNTPSNTISVIDVPSRALVTNISTDPSPLRGQFNRRGDRVYVINEIYSYLTVIDPFSLSVVRRASVSMGLSAIKVDINTDLIYLGRRRDPVVEVYNPSTFFPVNSIRADGGVTYITIDNEERKLHMVSPERNSLIISDLTSQKVVSELDVGEGPYWVTLMGER
jgi:YVTN family beta-propeller protein